MRRLVVDAGTVLSWFDRDGAGADLRRDYEAGGFTAIAPRRLYGDVLADVARRTGWPADRLARVGAELQRLGIELQEPPLSLLAGWLARGLDADRAPYAALAESLDLRLATSDEQLLSRAGALIDE